MILFATLKKNIRSSDIFFNIKRFLHLITHTSNSSISWRKNSTTRISATLQNFFLLNSLTTSTINFASMLKRISSQREPLASLSRQLSVSTRHVKRLQNQLRTQFTQNPSHDMLHTRTHSERTTSHEIYIDSRALVRELDYRT